MSKQRGGGEKMTPTQAIAQLKAKMRRSSHQVRGVFNNLDTDHDQIVSRVQFSRCLDRLGIHCEPAEVREIIKLVHQGMELADDNKIAWWELLRLVQKNTKADGGGAERAGGGPGFDGGRALEVELAKLVGQDEVKEALRALRRALALDKMRHDSGNFFEGAPHHYLFSGQPGTGKTRVARLIAMVYMQLGLLETGNLVEVQRSDLVAGHIGQTAAKTREKIEEAKGGVLFIDEAYTLVGRGEKDFGIEAIEEIMRVMNEGDPVCIFAGYKGEMSEFIEANPGLYRRITRKFNFNDYTAAQLADMTSKYIKEQGFEYDDRGYLRALFEGTVDLGIDAAGKPTGTGPIAAPPTPPPLHGAWQCKVCTFCNEPEHQRCQMCDVGTRPSPASRALPPPRPALQPLPLERRELYGRLMYELIHANNGGLVTKLVSKAKEQLDLRLDDRAVALLDEAERRVALFRFEDADFTAAMAAEVSGWLEHGKNMEAHHRKQAFRALRADKEDNVQPPPAAPAPALRKHAPLPAIVAQAPPLSARDAETPAPLPAPVAETARTLAEKGADAATIAALLGADVASVQLVIS